jgi:hypothetical protein
MNYFLVSCIYIQLTALERRNKEKQITQNFCLKKYVCYFMEFHMPIIRKTIMFSPFLEFDVPIIIDV